MTQAVDDIMALVNAYAVARVRRYQALFKHTPIAPADKAVEEAQQALRAAVEKLVNP